MFVVGSRRRIEDRVSGTQAPLHLRDLFRADAKVFCHRLCLGMRQPGKTLLFLAKIEKQFALRLGRGDLDDAPVLEHEFVDFRANPVNGK